MNQLKLADLIAVYNRVKKEPALLIGIAVTAASCFQAGMSVRDFVPLAAAAVIRQFVSPAKMLLVLFAAGVVLQVWAAHPWQDNPVDAWRGCDYGACLRN